MNTCGRDGLISAFRKVSVKDVVAKHIGQTTAHGGPSGVEQWELRSGTRPSIRSGGRRSKKGMTVFLGNGLEEILWWLNLGSLASSDVISVIDGDETVSEELLRSDSQ